MAETNRPDRQGDPADDGIPDDGSAAGPPRGPDRRHRPTPMFSRYTFFGRRRRNRRTDDPQKRYYVDWVSGGYLWALIGVLALIAADTFSTLYIIHRGGGEANPLMRTLLETGPHWFAAVKVGSALIAFLLLAVHRFFPLARMMVTVLLAAYGGIVIFHLFLLCKIHA